MAAPGAGGADRPEDMLPGEAKLPRALYNLHCWKNAFADLSSDCSSPILYEGCPWQQSLFLLGWGLVSRRPGLKQVSKWRGLSVLSMTQFKTESRLCLMWA